MNTFDLGTMIALVQLAVMIVGYLFPRNKK